MDFHKNCWKYSSYKPKHLCKFLAKSIENFYFYLNLNLFFNILKFFYYRIPILKMRTGKNRQISSQKSKSVSLRPKNEKKSLWYLFSLQRYVCLKIGGRSHANSVGRFLAQFSQKLFNLWRSDSIGYKTYILIFVTITIWPPNNEQFLR